MIKTVKRTLPIVVFIILGAGVVGLWIQSFQIDLLIGGIGVALISGLLFYAVIDWDDALEHKKRETRQLANVVDQAMDAIIICNTSGSILYANAVARQNYDLRDCETKPKTLDVIGLRGDRMVQVLDQVVGGEPWNGELRTIDKEGLHRVHLINLFLLEEFRGHTPAVAGIGRDMTQRRELERQLRHSQKLAAVGELAAGVAHEINNPLASIQSQIGLAGDLLTLRDESAAAGAARSTRCAGAQVLACLENVGQQVQRCSRIVESLLRFSRPGEARLAEITIDQAVRRAVQFTQSLPKMKNMQVIYKPGAHLPTIKSDADGISQILVNLMVNAADALQHEGKLWIKTHQPCADAVTIEVIDNGCGIEPQHIERVFEPFFTTKAPDEGTGLGLSISYGIARSLGGDLALDAPPQGGTRATLTLPARA